jgi:branched-subunit amino acid transport protein
MEVRPEILGLVLACAMVTAAPRVLPLVLLSRLRLPRLAEEWLRHVPLAVLQALRVLELLGTGLAGVLPIAAALAVAARTGSLLGTVIAGVALYGVLA